MRVDLLEHNQEAYEKIKSEIADGQKKIAVSHATGTGKSYLIAKLFEDYNNDKKLVLVPSTYISDQINKLFEKYSIQNVDVILYQKLIKMSDEDIAAMDYGVIVLDEYHHNISKVWGEKVRKLIDTHPESIIFGTSATPIRSDGVNTIDELFEGNCASDLPLSESIAKKIVPLPKYVAALYTLDEELEKLRKKIENSTNTKEEKKEFYKKINAMRAQIEKSYGMPIILNKHIKNREGKYIIFCKKKKHLREIKDTVIGWFKTAGFKDINTYEVYSDYESKDVEYKAFCNVTSHNLKLLFCVNMLNEGLHLENISGVLLLRPTRSSIVWHQQIGRAIEANNINMPVIIDAVNNFSSVGQGMELMREIKDAVAKEKESDPDFDDSGFEDIETFFVVGNVIEIQEMFKEIEGGLHGSWDLYIKALKQYKEREGDCDVPQAHNEVVDGRKISLGNWCRTVRGYKNSGLEKEKEIQLKQMGFVWDVHKYIFENKIKRISEYYSKYGKYPSSNIENSEIRKLGNFINDEKIKMRGENYPDWKVEIVQKYLPDFSCKTRSNKSLDSFIYYANLYKERYGHVDIKELDTIENFPIGIRLQTLRGMYKDGKLSDNIIFLLDNIGIYLKDKRKKRFNEKMELVRQAVLEGVVISKSNQFYKCENIYQWLKEKVWRIYKNNELSNNEIEIIERLVKQPLYKFYTNSNFVQVNDVIKNKKIICKSQSEAIRIIQKEFNLKIDMGTITNRLTGKVTTPYKGRFMFYYATDEEVRKYLEENKVS